MSAIRARLTHIASIQKVSTKKKRPDPQGHRPFVLYQDTDLALDGKVLLATQYVARAPGAILLHDNRNDDAAEKSYSP